MSSTFMGLEIGKRALFAQQAGLNTVGQNVANANTPGYSRQRVNLTATNPVEYPNLGKSVQAGQQGTGVVATSIDRIRDQFLDAQYRNENKGAGEWESRTDTLDKIQAIFNEPSDDALSSVINNFFASWQTLASAPDDMPARSQVLLRTQDLVDQFHLMDTRLSELDGDISESISAKVKDFNDLTAQIGELNKQISTLEQLGDKANDLRDRRDYMVDQLSKMADITTNESADGTYTITMGGTNIVNGIAPVTPITYDPAANTTSVPVTSGEIGGLMASRTQYVSVYRTQLDSMVNGLVNGKIQSTLPNDYTFPSTVTTLPFRVELPDHTVLEKGANLPAGGKLPTGTIITFEGINALHQFGYTLQNPAQKAGSLFVTSDGSSIVTAKNIRVAQPIIDDLKNIASSSNTYTSSPASSSTTTSTTSPKQGNGDIALMIGELSASVIDFKDGLPPNAAILTKGSIPSYMRAMVGQLGSQGQQAERETSHSNALVSQVDNLRQSISGVSIDEEMTNMIKFQQSYAAAARVVNTMDTILDTIVNRLKN